MQFYQLSRIIEFFDVSIVMPFYKKLNDFKRVLPFNQRFFQRNGIEVIIALDEEGEEKALLNFIQEYPLINWKIVINREAHEWRNPCKVLNVGIRNANNKYILVIDPEVEMYTDVIYQLRYIVEQYPKSFATGRVLFSNFLIEINNEILWQYPHRPYGSIMVEKQQLEQIGGYSETYTIWGMEDDNIRKRLELAGFKQMDVVQAIAIHREDNSDEHKSRTKKSDELPIDILKDALYPNKSITNNGSWGEAFKEICYDWKYNKNDAFRRQLLGEMETHQIKSPDVFIKEYNIIALIPTRNESKYVPDVLFHLDNYCDGIILLDDGSTDDTYEKANSDKLLLKVKSKYKGYFDDLGNRNTLLKLGHLFKTKWFFFTDADERFEANFADFKLATTSGLHDIIAFKMVHLWNNPFNYRVDILEGENGLMFRYRMFRNVGFMQILSKRDVHFRATPYENKVYHSDILITNLGFMEESVRKRKYENYKTLDNSRNKQGYNYDYLLDENPVLAPLDDLKYFIQR